jgi:hypothetical protein
MDDSRMGEIVFSYNPHQEGLTKADAPGLTNLSAFVKVQ